MQSEKPTTTQPANGNTGKKIQLLRLRTFAVEKLPKQDTLHTKLPYVRGFQLLRDEKTYYLSYRCQELKDDVEGPRWNPDMMFHISEEYASPIVIVIECFFHR